MNRAPRALVPLSILCAALLASACGHAPEPRGGGAPAGRAAPGEPRGGGGAPAPGTRGGVAAAGPAELRPAVAGAPRYNDPARGAPPVTPLARALGPLVAESAAAAGRTAPIADGRLFSVAAELARAAVLRGPPPYGIVEFVLAHVGIVEPTPHIVVVQASRADPGALADELRGRLPGILGEGRFARYGAGEAEAPDGGTVYVLALQESFVETEPVPRRLEAGARARLRGRLLPPYQDPGIFVTRADGAVERVPLVRDGAGGFRAELACGPAPGRIQVEIVGEEPASGGSVLANFPLWCGETPPAAIALPALDPSQPPVRDVADAERQLFALANEDRRRAGLPALAWDDRAAAVARAHSVEMRDRGFVGHVSPTTGTAADRVRRAGLATPLVLENLARAYSPAEAEAGLMNSPGHRRNLLSREATHLGVGVAFGEAVEGHPELYVTQVFFRVLPKVDAARARAAAREVIARRRADAGVGALGADRALDELAQTYATGLASGATPADQLAAATARSVEALTGRFGEMLTVVTIVGDPGQIAAQAALDGSLRHYGLGLAQGHDARFGDGALFVVIILGTGRR